MLKNLKNKLLVYLGYRSKCCGAETEYNEGWDRTYCLECDKRIR